MTDSGYTDSLYLADIRNPEDPDRGLMTVDLRTLSVGRLRTLHVEAQRNGDTEVANMTAVILADRAS